MLALGDSRAYGSAQPIGYSDRTVTYPLHSTTNTATIGRTLTTLTLRLAVCQRRQHCQGTYRGEELREFAHVGSQEP